MHKLTRKRIRPIRKIKHSIQKIRYGITDKDMWNADTYLAGVYIHMLDWYINKSIGVPLSYGYDLDLESPESLDIMIKRRDDEYRKYINIFKEYQKNGLALDKEWQKEFGGLLEEEIREAVTWIANHYTEFWD